MHISALWRHPVKSCQGVAIESAQVDAYGFVGDRLFAIISSDGRMLSQKTLPLLNEIEVDLSPTELVLRARNREDLVVDSATIGRSITVDMHGQMPGECMGDTAADWLSGVLGRACRLVRSSGTFSRQDHPAAAHMFLPRQQRYPDAGPIHIIAQSSLEDLSVRTGVELAPTRFRPNILIDGAPAYAEDSWRRIRVGDVSFTYMAPCERCGVTLLKPQSIERGLEPLRTLRGYRRMATGFTSRIIFGSFFRPLGLGTVRRGDPIEILETGPPLVFERRSDLPPTR
jgi:uncharacterized protein YcbX